MSKTITLFTQQLSNGVWVLPLTSDRSQQLLPEHVKISIINIVKFVSSNRTIFYVLHHFLVDLQKSYSRLLSVLRKSRYRSLFLFFWCKKDINSPRGCMRNPPY